MIAEVKAKGDRLSSDMKAHGHAFEPVILAPRVAPGGGGNTPLSAAILKLDWKLPIRREMVEHARDIITKALMLDSLDSATVAVLKGIIEGSGLYEYNIGEFFQLYGKFEGQYQVGGTKTRDKMNELIKGNSEYMKGLYYSEGVTESMADSQPLPYAVRNILAHTGTDTNTLDPEGKDIRKSIELLHSWVKDS